MKPSFIWAALFFLLETVPCPGSLPKRILTYILKRSMTGLIPRHFSKLVNFQHNPNLMEPAVKARPSKGLKVKPPRDFGSLPEAFASSDR